MPAQKKKKLQPKKKGAKKPASNRSTQFKIGNQFWKMRSKHGRDKLFATAELLWEAACEYFQWCDENPWYKNEAVKAGDHFGEHVQIPIARPYTIKGLCIYLDCNSEYFRQFKASLGNEQTDFSRIILLIEETIYTQKFEGAAVGAFNSNIIARDLGLTDKKDVTSGGESLNKGFYDYLKMRRTKKEQ